MYKFIHIVYCIAYLAYLIQVWLYSIYNILYMCCFSISLYKCHISGPAARPWACRSR